MRDYDILVRVELDGGNSVHEERRKIDNDGISSDAAEFAEALWMCLKGAGLPRLTALLADVAISAGRSFDSEPSDTPYRAAVSEAEAAFKEAAIGYIEALYQYDAGDEIRRQSAMAGRK